MRSGAQTLLLLAAPTSVGVLGSLAERPQQPTELCQSTGLPPQTTLRAQLRRLLGIGAIETYRHSRLSGARGYELTAGGMELLEVARTLEGWLAMGPNGPQPLGGSPAKAATKALAEGWATTMLRALAARPMSLTELDGVIGSLTYPALERRLAALRLTGLVEPQPSAMRGTPYAVTAWLRHGIAPLTAAARWERRHRPADSPPIAGLDVETGFLLPMPLLRLPAGLSGSCRMAVEINGGNSSRLAGAILEVNERRVSSCSTRVSGRSHSWALGSVRSWLNAVIDGEIDPIELGGDCRLARSTVAALHDLLFKPAAATKRSWLDIG